MRDNSKILYMQEGTYTPGSIILVIYSKSPDALRFGYILKQFLHILDNSPVAAWYKPNHTTYLL